MRCSEGGLSMSMEGTAVKKKSSKKRKVEGVAEPPALLTEAAPAKTKKRKHGSALETE